MNKKDTKVYENPVLIKEVKKRAVVKELSDKHLTLMLLLNEWLKIKQGGVDISNYFLERNIKNIAIYGMSYIGERLYDELDGTEIKIKYAIDRNVNKVYRGLKIISPDEELSEVDVVVVTPVFYYDEIKIVLQEKITGKIISIEDIIYKNMHEKNVSSLM